MKNRSIKTILVFFALGLIGCAFCVQQAQAVPIGVTGAITFAGGVTLDTDTVNTAHQVLTWLDESGDMPTVQSASGSFAASGIMAGDSVNFTNLNWSFNSGVMTAFWQVGVFTFNLIASNIIPNGQTGNGFVFVSGTGTITAPGFDTTDASWSFSAQDDPSNGVFSFSGGSQAPDGGATVALLGLALAGIECTRRKLMRSKS